MTTLAGLLGLKSAAPTDNRPAPPEDINVMEMDEELFSPLAAQMGEENEAIRNLLVEAQSKLYELDSIRDAFGRLVEPVSKTLLAFEEERTKKLSLQTILNNTRVAYGKMRSELAAADKKATEYEAECARLAEDLFTTQNTLRAVEDAQAEQAGEYHAQRNKLIEIERRLKQELKEREDTREENRRFGERLIAADKRIVELEAEAESARQKVLLAERECSMLQSNLAAAQEENSRLSRRLIDAENAVDLAQNRLRQMETSLAEISAERTRLASILDEANEQHRAEITTHKTRFETLQTRAATTEKLLEEAREHLAARADDIRAFDRRMIEASLVRNALESKLDEIEQAYAERESQLTEAEQARAALAERSAVLTKAVMAREVALTRAEEAAVGVNDRVAQLENALANTQQAAEQQIEDLHGELGREKLGRAVAEGALETARKDFARILRELQTLQARRGESDESQPFPLPKYDNAA
jgi:chromosome segregation ATPase